MLTIDLDIPEIPERMNHKHICFNGRRRTKKRERQL
jgi:hypothetical protein